MNQTSTGFTMVHVVERIQENSHTTSLVLDMHLPSAEPGQFVMVWLPEIGEKPFSLAGNAPLRLTIAAVGPVSQALCKLNVGSRLWFRGPLGEGYNFSGQRHLLVGGGYGAAPLSFLAKEILELDQHVSVCLGARCKDDLFLADELSEMGCLVHIFTEDGSVGSKGMVTLGVLAEMNQTKPDQVYACGPKGMLAAVFALCVQYEVPCQLSWEALIRCGMGLCGSCELEPVICKALNLPNGWLVCKDGPVSKWSSSRS